MSLWTLVGNTDYNSMPHILATVLPRVYVHIRQYYSVDKNKVQNNAGDLILY